MKTLLVLRHAKSDWDNANLKDFDRPLSPRGEREAPRLGAVLRDRGVMPDIVRSSSAVRARETTEAVLKAARSDVSPEFSGRMYGASSEDLIAVVRSLPDSCQVAMLVGHNPGVEELVSDMTGDAARMTTSALACIQIDTDHWIEAGSAPAHLLWRTVAKELPDVPD